MPGAAWDPGLPGQPVSSTCTRARDALVHAKQAFTVAHFRRWLELFNETIDLGWSGATAERAKALAANVARVHSSQLLGEPFELEADASASS